MSNNLQNYPSTESTRIENSVKQNVGFQYRPDILDDEMKRNGNILFERFPIQTRLEGNNQSTLDNSFQNNYYLNNQIFNNQPSVDNNISTIHTRVNNLSEKSDRFYVPNPSSNNIPSQYTNDLGVYYPENTRLRSKTTNQGYTPNPGASSLPVNNPNTSTDIIMPMTTRIVNKYKNDD